MHGASITGNAPAIPEPSLAERARTLVATGRIGTLSTHSRRFPGFPFGSVMPYAVDETGCPIFFISTMAMHTQNLDHDPRASLLIAAPETAADALGAARVTLLGTVATAPPEEVRDLYLSRYENARYWAEYSDFSYQRLHIEGVYFVGGFGVMGWVAAGEYAAAQPDPLADIAEEIIAHMNADHSSALVAIARHYIGEAADDARMTAVDRLGFHLRLTSGGQVRGRRIAFLREARSRTEARAVLVEMARAARA